MSETGKKITRDELFKAVWAKPIKTLAQEWNTTYLRITEACRDMEIPRPSQGHWQLVKLGCVPEEQSLPIATEGIPLEVYLIPKSESREEATATARPATEVSLSSCTVLGESSTSVRQQTKAEDAPTVADQAVLNLLRQAKKLDFWKESISEQFRSWELQKWLGIPEESKLTEAKLLSQLKKARKDYRAFQVAIDETKSSTNPNVTVVSIELSLRPGYEWRDACEEAWSLVSNPNAACLSDNALRLYDWAKGPKNTGKMTERRKIGAQARLRKTYDEIEAHLREIRAKADPTIHWEKQGDLWNLKVRVWFGDKPVAPYQHGPLNPPLGLDLEEVYKTELDRFRTWLHAEILRPGFPDQAEGVGVFDIRDRKTVLSVFSVLPKSCGRYGNLPDFFNALRLMDGIEIQASFEEGSGPWLVMCQPAEGLTWQHIKERLKAKAEEVPIQKKYGLSADSSALLTWILELRSEEFELGMTPGIEEAFEGDIGIETDCGKENIRAYTELLVEEINEKTEFDVRLIRWHHYSQEETRILVRKKKPDFEKLLQSVQVFALREGKLVEMEHARESINRLLGRSDASNK